MGRIKTKLIKRISIDLVKQHTSDMKEDFDNNKQFVERHTIVTSKNMRNVIAGYVTRQAEKQ
jgi:small subunit ribosomal protein S17e